MGSNFAVDVRRVSEMLELPLKLPNPDPVSQYRGEDGRPRTSEEQPYIYRLTRLGIVAEENGRGIEFADEISRAIWSGPPSHESDHLAKATDRAGLDLAELDRIALEEEVRIEGIIGQNQEDHAKAGHWCVPTCTH